MKKRISRLKPVVVLDVIKEFEDLGSWDEDLGSWDEEPFNVLQRKVEFLMQELNITEQQANRMLFRMIGGEA